MSEIINGRLDQYGTGPFEQQHVGTAGVEGVKHCHLTDVAYSLRYWKHWSLCVVWKDTCDIPITYWSCKHIIVMYAAVSILYSDYCCIDFGDWRRCCCLAFVSAVSTFQNMIFIVYLSRHLGQIQFMCRYSRNNTSARKQTDSADLFHGWPESFHKKVLQHLGFRESWAPIFRCQNTVEPFLAMNYNPTI